MNRSKGGLAEDYIALHFSRVLQSFDQIPAF